MLLTVSIAGSMRLLETAYFTSQTQRDKTLIDERRSKIKVPLFLLCKYVCEFVCVFVRSLAPTPFTVGSSNLVCEVYM